MGGRTRAGAVLVAGLAVALAGIAAPMAVAQSPADACRTALLSLPIEDLPLPDGYAWTALQPAWTGAIAAVGASTDAAQVVTITLGCDPDAAQTFERAAAVRAALGLERLLATVPVGEEHAALRWTEGPLTGTRIDWRDGPFVGSVANRHVTASGQVVPITVLEEIATSLDALIVSTLIDPPPAAATPSPAVGSARVIDLELTSALQILADGAQASSISVIPGETIELRLTNSAGFQHSFWIGPAERLAEGQTSGLPGIPEWDDPEVRTLRWEVPRDVSRLRFGCTIPGHLALMSGDVAAIRSAADRTPRSRLTMSRNELRIDDLPATVDIRFEVHDAQGHPFDGATVVFSLSAPGLPTEVHEAILEDGVARWRDAPLALESAERGNGFVTARADLGPAIEAATATRPFVIR